MSEEQFTIEEITVQLATWLMEDRGTAFDQALSDIYNSDTYSKLINTDNGLIAQSDAYIYDCLTHELETGKIGY